MIIVYEVYVVEGYELNIVDYLFKLFGFECFVKVINKVVLRKMLFYGILE